MMRAPLKDVCQFVRQGHLFLGTIRYGKQGKIQMEKTSHSEGNFLQTREFNKTLKFKMRSSCELQEKASQPEGSILLPGGERKSVWGKSRSLKHIPRERNSRCIQLYFILLFKLQKDEENHRVISSLNGGQVDTAFRQLLDLLVCWFTVGTVGHWGCYSV